MIILYTTQCFSTTGEVISTASYCKHRSYYPGERPHLSFSCTYRNMMLLQVEDCRSFIQKACRDLEGNGEVVFGLPFPVIPHQPISLNMSMWVTISLNMSMWVTITLICGNDLLYNLSLMTSDILWYCVFVVFLALKHKGVLYNTFILKCMYIMLYFYRPIRYFWFWNQYFICCLYRAALKNVYMLEYHPSLSLAAKLPEALSHAYWVCNSGIHINYTTLVIK